MTFLDSQRMQTHLPGGQPGSQQAFASPVHALPALFQGLPSPPRPLPLPSPGPPGPPAGRQPLLFSLGFAPLLTAVGPDPLKSSHRAFGGSVAQLTSLFQTSVSRTERMNFCGLKVLEICYSSNRKLILMGFPYGEIYFPDPWFSSNFFKV